MTIRKLADGSIEFDTAAEIYEYERLSRGVQHVAPVGVVPAIQSEWEAFYAVLCHEHYSNQRRLLIAIKRAGKTGITRVNLMSELGVDGNALGGRLSGLTKACQKAGVEPHRIVRKDGESYFATPLLESNEVSQAVG